MWWFYDASFSVGMTILYFGYYICPISESIFLYCRNLSCDYSNTMTIFGYDHINTHKIELGFYSASLVLNYFHFKTNGDAYLHYMETTFDFKIGFF